MGTFQNVSRNTPCAICGKSDWCSIFYPDTVSYPGQKLYVCRRIDEKEVTSPVDGNTYYHIKELADCSHLYSDAEKDFPSSSNHYLPKKTFKKPQTLSKREEGIQPLSNSELDVIYRDFLKELPLSRHHIQKLQSDGWSKELILKSHVRSLALPTYFDSEKGYRTDYRSRVNICENLIKKFHTLQGVPGFFQDSSNKWTFSGKQGMLFPLFDKNGNLFRLRLRLDHPEKDESGKEKNKYKNFSSYYPAVNENGIISNSFLNGCRSGSHLGFYFDSSFDDTTMCIITEGEKKALVANYHLHCIVISVPGVNSFGKLSSKDENGQSAYDYLRSINCKKIAVAYDADKETNKTVLRCEQKLISAIKEEGFEAYSSYWNAGFGKGLDDILVLGIMPNFIPM